MSATDGHDGQGRRTNARCHLRLMINSGLPVARWKALESCLSRPVRVADDR